jgi:hypothetical protein
MSRPDDMLEGWEGRMLEAGVNAVRGIKLL